MSLFAHQAVLQYTAGGNTINANQTFTDDLEALYSSAIAASTTNQEADISFLHANLQEVFLYSDQAVTLKTNSSGSPVDTINLPAGSPIAWNLVAQLLSAAPFSADVTKIFITNAGTKTANVFISVLSH